MTDHIWIDTSVKHETNTWISNSKINESTEEVVFYNRTNEKAEQLASAESRQNTNDKKLALLEALAHNYDSCDDAIMLQLNDHIGDIDNSSTKKRSGFEILEINNTDNSPNDKSDSCMPKTPVKCTQSETKIYKGRNLNFDDVDIEEKFNQEPQRRSRNKDDSQNVSKVQDKSILDSLEVSKVTGNEYRENDQSESDMDLTINISPPPLKDCLKSSGYDRTSKELGINSNSPDEDFEINENELDENFNMNIYSDEGFEQLEKECQDELQQNQRDEENLQPIKNYYLKQSQYLSGITEQSVEESVFVQSADNVSLRFDENKSKRLLISKYSCTDEAAKRDSMAFLYDKLKEQLEKTSENSADDCEISLSPFDLACEKPNSDNNVGAGKETPKKSENMGKSLKNCKFEVQVDSIKNEKANKNTSAPLPTKIDPKYSTFRQDSKGILTLDELIQENRSTPSKETRVKKASENAKDSPMSFSTLSNKKSKSELESHLLGDSIGRHSITINSKKPKDDANVNKIEDFSSIKKFEESGSTLRKDNSNPDFYGSLPISKNIELSPEIKSKDKRTNGYQSSPDDISKFSDEKRSTLPLHSDSFNKHSERKDS